MRPRPAATAEDRSPCLKSLRQTAIRRIHPHLRKERGRRKLRTGKPGDHQLPQDRLIPVLPGIRISGIPLLQIPR